MQLSHHISHKAGLIRHISTQILSLSQDHRMQHCCRDNVGTPKHNVSLLDETANEILSQQWLKLILANLGLEMIYDFMCDFRRTRSYHVDVSKLRKADFK